MTNKKQFYASEIEKSIQLARLKPEDIDKIRENIKGIFDSPLDSEMIYSNLKEINDRNVLGKYYGFPTGILGDYRDMVSESLSTDKPEKYFKVFSNFFLKNGHSHKHGMNLIANREKIEKIKDFDYSNRKSRKVDQLVEQIWDEVPGSAEKLIKLVNPKEMKFMKAISDKNKTPMEKKLKDDGIFNMTIFDKTGLKIIDGHSPSEKVKIQPGMSESLSIKNYPVKVSSVYKIANVHEAFIIGGYVKSFNNAGGHYDSGNMEIILKDRWSNIVPIIAHETQHLIDDLCGINYSKEKHSKKEYSAMIEGMIAELTYGNKGDNKKHFNWFLSDYYDYTKRYLEHKKDGKLLHKLLAEGDAEDNARFKEMTENKEFREIMSRSKDYTLHTDAVYEIYSDIAGKKLEKNDCKCIYINYNSDAFKKPNIIKSLVNLRDKYYKEKIGIGYNKLKDTCKKLIKGSNYC